MSSEGFPLAAADVLERMLRFHEHYAERLVADLTPQQMVECPGPGHENHPAFTIGHLITASNMLAQTFGLPSELPTGWGRLFLRRGPSDRRYPEAGEYPLKEALLAELKRQHDRVIAAMRSAGTDGPGSGPWYAGATEPWRFSAFFPTNFESVLFMAVSHFAMHLGQIAAWRRAMGLPAALAQM